MSSSGRDAMLTVARCRVLSELTSFVPKQSFGGRAESRDISDKNGQYVRGAHGLLAAASRRMRLV